MVAICRSASAVEEEHALSARRPCSLGLDTKDFLDGFACQQARWFIHRVQPTVVNDSHPVRESADGIEIMDGHRNRLASFRKPPAQIENLQSVLDVEVRSRLI